jgi:hypothetical protein
VDLARFQAQEPTAAGCFARAWSAARPIAR